MDNEKWKDIEGFGNWYQVSNKGRIRSFKNFGRGDYRRKDPIVLSPGIASGYYMVVLHFNGRNSRTVHRLVAKAFIPNPENKPEVNHKDGNKLNNRVTNLEWVTKSENAIHSFRIGTQSYDEITDRLQVFKGENHGSSKLSKKDVLEIRKIARESGRFYGRKELANKHGVSETTIKDIVNYRTWTHLD